MNRKITIIGIGMEGNNTLTKEALAAVCSADVIIGAERMTKMFSYLDKPVFNAYDPKKIKDHIENSSYENIAVTVSGDSGFYSGAEGIVKALEGHDVKIIPGVSSLSYLSSKIKIPYENIKVVSLHGACGNIVRLASSNERVFALLGGDNSPAAVCRRLTEYERGNIKVYIGENLGTSDEKITIGNAIDFISGNFSALSVIITENKNYEKFTPIGIPDEKFIRGNIPMTKSDIRAAAVSRLEIGSSDICWDIGSGTGSVSVEMAMHCPLGKVYAVEKNSEAVKLSEKNYRAFGCDNIIRISSEAPSGLDNLPAPDCVFIGGTSGKLREITETVLKKNQKAKIVCTAVSLETLSEAKCMGECEITQIISAKTEKLGEHTMLKSENPVFVIRRIVK